MLEKVSLTKALTAVRYNGRVARWKEGISEIVIQRTDEGEMTAVCYTGPYISEWRFSDLPKTGWILN
ncbi:MAG: hypothetical protein ACOYJ1_15710 [Peptococcales bacterium]|jgi:hypothetical protein